MNLTISYKHTKAETRVLTEVACGAELKEARSRDVLIQIWEAVALALAMFASFRAEMFFLMCFFVTSLGFHLTNAINGRRKFWQAIEREAAGIADREVTLTIRDDGLHESTEGITSHVVWSSVKDFTIHKNILIIRLPANLNAVIPASTLKPHDVSLEAIAQILRERGIAETKTCAVW
ncbi:MAG: hypothetical protein ABMA26_27110 [Limisphaerales bacterium]